MQNLFIILEDSTFAEQALQIEGLLCGEWRNKATNQRWLFSRIKQNDRYGQLIISSTNDEEAMKLDYEVIWVREGLVLLNLLRAWIELMEQYRICFEGIKILKMTYLPGENEMNTEPTILQRLSPIH